MAVVFDCIEFTFFWPAKRLVIVFFQT